MKLKHELWVDEEGLDMFCLSGKHGDDARKLLGPDAKLIWTVEAGSNFEAMTAYYKFRDRGEYTTDQEWDLQPYPEDWLQN